MNYHHVFQIIGHIRSKIPWKALQAVLLAFILTRLMIFAITYLSMIELPVRTGDVYWRSITQNILADGMVRWDSGFYRDIILRGYPSVSGGRATAFFPSYPIIVWLLYKVIGHVYLSGLLVSNITFLIALFYLYALVRQEYDDREIASRAVFYLAAAPSAFIFSAMYTESTFLAFLIASFYYARNRHWVLAALTGAAASAARAPGVAVAIFILLEGFHQQGIRYWPAAWSLKTQIDLLLKDGRLALAAWPSILAAAGATTGLWIYMIYLKIVFGDPLSFLHVQSFWGRQVTDNWLTSLTIGTINRLNLGGNLWAGQINVNLLQDVLATLVFIPLVIVVMLKMRPAYGIFTFISFLIPLLSSSAVSMRRYVLTLVPCFILIAIWGRRPWVDRVVVVVSLTLQAYLTILFTHWYFAG